MNVETTEWIVEKNATEGRTVVAAHNSEAVNTALSAVTLFSSVEPVITTFNLLAVDAVVAAIALFALIYFAISTEGGFNNDRFAELVASLGIRRFAVFSGINSAVSALNL